MPLHTNLRRRNQQTHTGNDTDTRANTPSKRRRLSGTVSHQNTSTSTVYPTPASDPSSSTPNISSSTSDRTGPLLEYKYIGKCKHSRERWHARFWYEERIKDSSRRARPRYHRCCMAGRVVLRTYQIYPEYIKLQLADCHFMENIRAYNQMFSMTSLGACVDESINIGRGPYVLKISGQLYHWLGSLCLAEGGPPRFLQLYIYDTENEVDNRMSHLLDYGSRIAHIRLIELLDNHNALVQLFRTAPANRGYVRTIVYEPGPHVEMDYDIVIEQRLGPPQLVNKLHPSYMALQFPFLFLYGEDGYSKEMKMVRVPGMSSDEDRRLTMKAYYSYMLHDRLGSFNYLSKTKSGRWKSAARGREYNSSNKPDTEGSSCFSLTGFLVVALDLLLILPQSFTGGPRYMYAHYLDALAICRVHGNPSYFITFTCNVKWPEIAEYMEDFPGLTTVDRADIVDRVFEMKIQQFVKYLRDSKPFGQIIAVVYTVEFQKRGLPHCHTLIWIDEACRIQNHEHIDDYVSVELPSKEVDPESYRIVSEFMIHGPCGRLCPAASCMKDKSIGLYGSWIRNTQLEIPTKSRCTKNFPKEYCPQTYIDSDGFVHYQRRDTGITTTKQNIQLDNGYVVPYNKQLLKTFYAHINVEYCGWTMLIKYLFKYISKGTDRIAARIARDSGHPSSSTTTRVVVDEIKNHLEACYRIIFRNRDQLQSVADNPHKKKTTLTEWLEYNERHTDGRHLTYLDFPSKFVWNKNHKYWKLRSHQNMYSVDRMSYVHPSAGYLFYQRMLLSHQKGCRSFREIRTVNGVAYPTCRAACEAMGLLGNDNEWETTLEEASLTATPTELRTLLAHILTHCDVSNPLTLWRHTWHLMKDDIPYVASISLDIPDLHIPSSDLENYILYELEAYLNHFSRSLTDFGIPLPPDDLMAVLWNRLLMEEKSYNRDVLAIERDKLINKLNDCQREIFNLVIDAFNTNRQELIFVYGHSGTAHSRFKLPLDLNDSSVCSITKNTQLAKLLKETNRIIWDESPMNDRRCFETLDRTLRDILDHPNQLFGGKTVMPGGDFRQTLPVKKGGSRTEIIHSSIAESYLWRSFKLFILTENMRLQQKTLSETEKEVSTFAAWLLNVGDGNVGLPDESDPENTSWIEIPQQFRISDDESGLTTLINFIYDNETLLHPTAQNLQ
ncbi:DNA helicase [Tanacetum coccineum]